MTTIEENPNKVEWNARRSIDSLDLKQARSMCSDLVALCHGAAIKAGWYNDPETGDHITYPPEFLLDLIRCELYEAAEALQSGAMDKHLPNRLSFEVEVADMLILIFSMCGALGLDIGNAIAEKVRFNLQRDDHKPENRPDDYGEMSK